MNTIKDYILKLEKLSKYYQDQGNLEQKELYNSFLNELRELYRRQPKDFTDQNIVEINKLKIIIKNMGSHYIKNCYFKIDNESDKIGIYVNTPVGRYSFINNILLNGKLENDEIQIKMNEKQEIVFIFDRLNKVYLYASLNQKIIRYREDNIYKFKHIYFNCQYYYSYTQSYERISYININFIGNQGYITYTMNDVLIKHYEHEYGIFKIIDKIGKNIFYFSPLKEGSKDFFDKIILNDYENNVAKIFYNYKYKNDIKVKLFNIAKNKYKDSLVIELKKYIYDYLNNYVDESLFDAIEMPPAELRIEYMYEYICSAIDEIVECKTEDVLNYNLKLIYKFIEDEGVQSDFDEGSIYDEFM